MDFAGPSAACDPDFAFKHIELLNDSNLLMYGNTQAQRFLAEVLLLMGELLRITVS